MPTSATNPPGLTPSVNSSPAKKKTPTQLLRIAERRRERKAEARTPRQQAAERTIQDLGAALDRIPAGEQFDEWRVEVNRTIARIRKSGKRTPDRAAKAVTDAFARPFNSNGATLEDLSADTDIPAADVQKILDGMLALGTARRSPKEVPVIARGRTIWLYFLTGKKPSTDLVLP